MRAALGLASLGAGAIHLALGPEHGSEWAPLGYGFFASGAAQVVLGLLLLLRAESRRVLALATLASVAFVGVWLLAVTTGLPVGPSAGRAEPSGLADQLCVALETTVALGALTLLRRPAAGLAPAGRATARAVIAGAFLIVAGSTGVAVAAPSHHGVPDDCPTSIIKTGVDSNANKVDDGVERYFACELKRAHEGHPGYNPDGTLKAKP